MAKSWLLTDVASGKYLESLNLGPADAPGAPAGFAVKKQRLRGGLSDGVDTLEVSNGKISILLLPTRGMSIAKIRSAAVELGWKSPVRGPVHPAFVDLGEPSGLGWLDGFDELFVRCGLESNGAPEHDEKGKLLWPLHGRIANRPAQRVELSIDDQGITVVGVVEESRFHFTKLRLTTTLRTKFGESGIQIQDTVENFSASPGGMQLLYHINFGQPLLDGGSRLALPAKTIVPRNPHAAANLSTWDSYAAEQPGFEEQVYFFELLAGSDGQTEAVLRNAHGTQGVSLRYPVKQLPCFSVWKNTTAGIDGYVTGLEPATNFPNPRSYEAAQKRVVPLAPGGKATFDLRLDLLGTAGEVEQAERRVAAIQGATKPTIHSKPLAGWCAGAE